MYYETSSGLSGYTDVNGSFDYNDGDLVVFSIGNVEIGQIDTTTITDGQVFLQDIAGTERTDMNDQYVENMAVLLQSLDIDGDAYNGIVITEEMHDAFSDDSFDLSTISTDDLVTILEENGQDAVAEDDAMTHVQDMLVEYTELEETDFEMREDEILMDGLISETGFDFTMLENAEEMDIDDASDISVSLDEILDAEESQDTLLIEESTENTDTLTEGWTQESTTTVVTTVYQDDTTLVVEHTTQDSVL
jgi:hypothetical protein